MSGHSKWSTIKRKKEATDQARGKIFSKLSRGISIAVKTGGGPNPDMNHKLRVAIDIAKAANMPGGNIERAITKAESSNNLVEITYEGFGPGGIGVIALSATDNRNRTVQEIKSVFERGGGQLAGPGSVSYNFESKGLILIKKTSHPEDQMLELIDKGVEDIEGTPEGIEAYVDPNMLSKIATELESDKFTILSSDLVQRPKSFQEITDIKVAQKALKFLESLEENDDIQKVFTNINIPDEVLEKVRLG